MKYLYTNNPDEWCHEISGVHGRPVHGKDWKALLAKGWVRDPSQLEVSKNAEESNSETEAEETTKEESGLSRDELAESLGVATHDEDGKKLHYKLIDSAIKEAQSNVEHKEG